jgi:hypothetical protein
MLIFIITEKVKYIVQCTQVPESIERFIEDRAFLRSYDLLPTPPSLHPFPLSRLSLFLSLPVCRRSKLLTGERGEGMGEEPNHMTARKPGPL